MGILCGPGAGQPCSQGLSSSCLLEQEGAGIGEILGTRLGAGSLAGLQFDIMYVKSLYQKKFELPSVQMRETLIFVCYKSIK